MLVLISFAYKPNQQRLFSFQLFLIQQTSKKYLKNITPTIDWYQY